MFWAKRPLCPVCEKSSPDDLVGVQIDIYLGDGERKVENSSLETVDYSGEPLQRLAFVIPSNWLESSGRNDVREALVECYRILSGRNGVFVTFGDECPNCLSILQNGKCLNPSCKTEMLSGD
jgi:hypothetical protein